ncbi:MAG: hypothetical protein HC786_12665 [Richelia sp. CSU_2_1]|nr:hypothetical protein [Microcoleus sp. SM1_3_4]NJR22944.1 hypothetical protein [Richelia sp. CSU_2_1]
MKFRYLGRGKLGSIERDRNIRPGRVFETVNYWQILSTIDYRLSTIDCQLSTVNYRS